MIATKRILVVAHGLSYGGAQVSTLQTLRLMRGCVDKIHVAVCSDANSEFVEDIRGLGLTLLPLPYRDVGHNPELQISSISDVIHHTDFAWITDEAYLSAPKIKQIKDIPIACHLRSYALICRTWGASCGLGETCMDPCGPLHLIRCKQLHNEDLLRLGKLSHTRCALYKLIDFGKGPLDYYTWPLRKGEIVDCMDGFVSVSRATLEIHKRHLPMIGEKPCDVIYDPIDVPIEAGGVRKRQQHELDENHRATVTYMDAQGGIPIKGPHVYLQAVKILLSEGTNIDAKLLGCKGTWVEDYASKLSLGGKVTFLERMRSIADVYQLMADSSVVVVPSVWPEPLSRVALEAQFLGVPVVGSRIGGLPEVIFDGETGYLAKAGSGEDFARKIQAALAAGFSEGRIRELAREKFDPTTQVQELVDFMQAMR